MPLVPEDQIPQLVTAVRRHPGVLYHSCQLRDFKTYLALGGVAARRLMVDQQMPHTPFDTDAIDQANGVFDKVFFNFSDFGTRFAGGLPWYPCYYGPICLVLNPGAIMPATDASITLRSAGAAGFDRAVEGLTLAEFPQLFEQYAFQKYRVTSIEKIRQAFPDRLAEGNPEMNCAFPNQRTALATVRYVLVDSYDLPEGQTLPEVVAGLFRNAGYTQPVIERKTKGSRKASYGDLWRAAAAGTTDLSKLRATSGLDAGTLHWSEGVRKWDKNSYFYGRFSSYLQQGTISEL